MTKRSLFSWAAEIAWQYFFYFILPKLCIPFIHSIAPYFASYGQCICVVTVTVLALGWIVPASFYGILYVGQFKCIEKYRIQEWVWNREDSPRKTSYMQVVRKTVEMLVIGQLLIFTPSVYYMFDKLLDHTDNIGNYLNRYGGPLHGFCQLMVGLVMFETCFYWFHRFLHTKYAYRFHKDHHAYYVPISLAGLWGHAIDGLLSLPIPAVLPIFVLDMHFITFLQWMLIHTCHSNYDHCGYDLPFDPFQLVPLGARSDTHNFHHSHNCDNFALYWRAWDYVMGTDQHWRAFQAEREAAVSKLNNPNNTAAESDNFVIQRDGLVLVKTCAEAKDMASGEDNLAYTMEHKMGVKDFNVEGAGLKDKFGKAE